MLPAYLLPIVEKYLPNSLAICLLSNISMFPTLRWSIAVVLSLNLPIHEFIMHLSFLASFTLCFIVIAFTYSF